MAYYQAPTDNYVSTTLNGSINDSVDTITLNDASKLQAPGYIVVDREDGNGNATPNSREVISYTGISGNDLTGCTRAADNSTARSHNDGALVEAVLTVGMWAGFYTGVNTAINSDGTGIHVGTATVTTLAHTPRLAVTSVASVARMESNYYEAKNLAVSSVASVSTLHLGLYGVHMASGTSISRNLAPMQLTAADAATITFDCSLSDKFEVTLGDNRVIRVINAEVGKPFLVHVVQDGTGSRTLTWQPTVYWVDATAPTLTTTANKRDTFGFIPSNATTYSGYIVGQNI